MVHADRLLLLETSQQPKCTMLDLFLEIDRLLRPEVGFIFTQTLSFAGVLFLKLKSFISGN